MCSSLLELKPPANDLWRKLFPTTDFLYVSSLMLATAHPPLARLTKPQASLTPRVPLRPEALHQ
jgi:hypothetical protein